ncbi:MAG: hypothetical protein Q8Q91_02625 [Candidatus Daviesbacteria bacterium]|nr:hypothetical protein [Candidatus Daviesbacteria bacterium]
MIENIDKKKPAPDIISLIQQTKTSQRLKGEYLSLIRRGGKKEVGLGEIIMNVAYGSYRLGLEVAGGLRSPVDIGKVKIEELFLKE